MHCVWTLDQERQHEMLAMSYEIAATLMMATGFIVGIFYSLDGLSGEGRDRSILLWKSLPVSDRPAVRATIPIPLVVVQLVSFAIAVVTQWIMLLLSSAVLLGSGLPVAMLWTQSSLLRVSLILLYHIVTVHGLWYAPIYGWLLLVSAWARRAPFLWAFLPPFVICGLEKIAFNTTHFLALLEYRLTGPEAPTTTPHSTMIDMLAPLTPAHFSSTTMLWIGLSTV